MRILFASAGLLLVATGPAAAQDQSPRTTLQEIRQTAEAICDKVSHEEYSVSGKLSADVDAELSKWLKKLADLGVKGAMELQAQSSAGVPQNELANVIIHTADCRKDVFDKLLVWLTPPPPPPGPRVSGWLATFGVKEQGGGSFRQFPARKCVLGSPAAIDIRAVLPPNLSPRNVFVSMAATTDHQVEEPGRWVYYVKVVGAPSSYTQCMNFEVQSDGAPIGGGALPILIGATSTSDTSAPVTQSKGMHTITVKLDCYFQGGQFPVTTLMIETPSGQWRSPTGGDFTVEPLSAPDKPPSAAVDGRCIDLASSH